MAVRLDGGYVPRAVTRDSAEPPLPVLYADEHLVAIDKPAGLLVHRSMLDRHETRFAVQTVRTQLGRDVHPVHRLDKPTSGVLLFALDRDTCRALSARFEAGEVDKRYVAIVRGHPAPAFTIDHPLARIDDEPGAAPALVREAQPAVTDGETLALAELPCRVDRYPATRYALVALSPRTGRRHQLRRHMKHVSHPLVGDTTYGKGSHNRFFAQHLGAPGLMLACVAMHFTHPISGVPVTVRTGPSEPFVHAAQQLGWEAILERYAGGESPSSASRTACQLGSSGV